MSDTDSTDSETSLDSLIEKIDLLLKISSCVTYVSAIEIAVRKALIECVAADVDKLNDPLDESCKEKVVLALLKNKFLVNSDTFTSEEYADNYEDFERDLKKWIKKDSTKFTALCKDIELNEERKTIINKLTDGKDDGIESSTLSDFLQLLKDEHARAKEWIIDETYKKGLVGFGNCIKALKIVTPASYNSARSRNSIVYQLIYCWDKTISANSCPNAVGDCDLDADACLLLKLIQQTDCAKHSNEGESFMKGYDEFLKNSFEKIFPTETDEEISEKIEELDRKKETSAVFSVLQKLAEDSKRELKELKKQLKRDRNEIAVLKTSIEAEVRESEENQETQRLRRKYRKSTNEIAELKAFIAMSDAQANYTQAKLKKTEVDAEMLEEEIKKQYESFVTLKAELRKRLNENEILNNLIEADVSKSEEKNPENVRLRREYQKSTNEIAGLEALITKSGAEAACSRTQLKKTEFDAEVLEEEVTNQYREVAILKAELRKRLSDNEILKTSIEAEVRKSEEKSQENVRLRRKYQESTNKIAELEAFLTMSDAEAACSQALLKKNEVDAEMLEEEIAEKDQTVAILQAQLRQGSSHIEMLGNRITMDNARICYLSVQVEAHSNLNDWLKDESARYRGQINRIKERSKNNGPIPHNEVTAILRGDQPVGDEEEEELQQ